jgi:hypothetical protein
MTPLDALSAALLPWQNFYVLVGTAAATLTGLMFVAITFGSSLVTRETARVSRAFLDPTFHHFVQVLLTACVLLMPVLQGTTLGALLVASAIFRLATLVGIFERFREAQTRNGDVELVDWVMSVILPGLCHVALGATGIEFILGKGPALASLAVVTLVLLAIGIHGAWELFVWVALTVNERRRDADATRPAAPERRD